MASTNQTTHYDLSQYIATDKPTYLVDYNGDMNKIDTALYGVDSLARENEASIGTLSDLGTTVKSNLVSAINEVNTQVGTNTGNISTNTQNISANTSAIGVLANLSTVTKTDLVSATNEVNSKVGTLEDKFELTDIDTCTITISGGTDGGSDIKCAKNSDGSIFKLYGMVIDTHQQWVSSLKYTFTNTGLPAVDTEYTINGAGSAIVYAQDGSFNTQYLNVKPLSLKYKTNGDIEVDLGSTGYTTVTRATFNACLYFNANFGDTPSE